ncbi:MAG TPA: glycogen-binding domain-containing protein [Candidatus Paceibacterota bacterium]|nr:glycogen-binding domain-containing protein [Verrucomicrobiota bacterium]HRY47037.1 glycogen-binding domain-containing protein [Candidatus Paceibacterota bacterium]HRZ99575.1 glycogen-binding domain-containing protein [Candidatus Paceibacterota bacterium]
MAKKTQKTQTAPPASVAPPKAKQPFTFHAPSAISVMLVGDFTHWQEQPIPMKRASKGLWQTEVELAPGVHHYRFLVDGEWRDDPECELSVANPFGTQNSVRKVG